ncbi:MAG TPA: cytochrome c/FTR1 family iron permease [Candidatus Binatia bacterium]|nr:cytochrome c/FTR1 family iron permease [Candidatus Binatia bacterium]
MSVRWTARSAGAAAWCCACLLAFPAALRAEAGAATGAAANPAAALVQLLDYLAVDYPGAVQAGRVVNPTEYEEMREFAQRAASTAAALPAGEPATRLQADAATLRSLIQQRADVAALRSLIQRMRGELIANYRIAVVPRTAPDLARGAKLFQENCAGCHGASGHGDGAAAASLDPKPTDFHDAERWRQRSLYGLYSTLSNGVAGTAMPSFGQLDEAQRWDLAFLAGSFGAPPAAPGEPPAWARLTEMVTATPAEIEAAHGAEGLQAMASFRRDPSRLAGASPVERARRDLLASRTAYAAGDAEGAYALALSGYLEGFELAEAPLDAVDPDLRHRAEKALLEHRAALQDRAPAEQVEQRLRAALELVDRSAERLAAGRLTGSAAFSASFIILVREGLEALLVIAALMAFLVKTGQRRGLPYLHAGWLGALALGGLLWWVSLRFVHVSGAARELTEGIGALFAAAVMFGLGFWMHNRSNSIEWQRYINQNLDRILGRGSLWGVAGLSFIAVFRECFEIVLFYQALWAQTDDLGRAMTFSGIGAASVVLVVIGALILKYSTRLPLRQFFAATGVFLFVLAVVFAGKGIVALQEAGQLPVMPVPGPRIDLLGIYPNTLSLALQAAMIVLGAVLLWRSRTGAE